MARQPKLRRQQIDMKINAQWFRSLFKALRGGRTPKQAAAFEAERERLDRIRNPRDWAGK
jgi:hypothetical protein